MTDLHERASRGELGPDEAMHLIDQASEELSLYEEDHDVAAGVDLSGAFDAFQVGLGAPWASIPLCVVGSLRLPLGSPCGSGRRTETDLLMRPSRWPRCACL